MFYDEDDDEILLGDDETDRIERWTCLFGDLCCMPGYHMSNECHTAEMYEQAQHEEYPATVRGADDFGEDGYGR